MAEILDFTMNTPTQVNVFELVEHLSWELTENQIKEVILRLDEYVADVGFTEGLIKALKKSLKEAGA